MKFGLGYRGRFENWGLEVQGGLGIGITLLCVDIKVRSCNDVQALGFIGIGLDAHTLFEHLRQTEVGHMMPLLGCCAIPFVGCLWIHWRAIPISIALRDLKLGLHDAAFGRAQTPLEGLNLILFHPLAFGI